MVRLVALLNGNIRHVDLVRVSSWVNGAEEDEDLGMHQKDA